VEIGADQQAEADLAQIAALLLIMPALRKFGRGAGIDVGEEIGAVVNQGAEIQLKPLDEALGDLLFAFQDVIAVTRSIWFQKFWEDSAAGSAGSRRVKVVCRYQSANCSLLVGDTARLMAASSRY